MAGCTQPATNSGTASPGASPDSQATQPASSGAHTIVWTKEPGVRVPTGIGPDTIAKDGYYYIYYHGRDSTGAGGLYVSRSADGLTFEQMGRIDLPGSNPAIIMLKNGSYRMIYEVHDQNDDRRLYSALSTDGLSWAPEDGVRFQDDSNKQGQIFTSVPNIKRLDNGDLRMYYCRGSTSAIAESKDEGLTWTKVKDIDLGNTDALDPDVTKLADGSYVMYVTAFDRIAKGASSQQYMICATSRDGLSFVLQPGKVVEPSAEGGMIVDPNVVALPDGRYRMYYAEMFDNGTSNIYSMIGTEQ